MGVHRFQSRIEIKQLVGAVLAVGGLLLAAPTAIATAADSPDGPGSGGGPGGGQNPGGEGPGGNEGPGEDDPGDGGGPGGGPTPGGPGGPGGGVEEPGPGPGPGEGPGGRSGVNNRPALARPALGVEATQRFGDQIFNSDNEKLDESALGDWYHTKYGSAGAPQDTDGILEPGEAYQGTWTGFLNTPGALESHKKWIEKYCARNPDAEDCAN